MLVRKVEIKHGRRTGVGFNLASYLQLLSYPRRGLTGYRPVPLRADLSVGWAFRTIVFDGKKVGRSGYS